MSFQVGIGSLGGTMFFQVRLCTPLRTMTVSALQIRAGQWSITANLWPLTTHIYHVMIIVTGGFSKKSFYYYYFYFI